MTLTAAVDSNPPNTIVLDQLEGNYQYNAGASTKSSLRAGRRIQRPSPAVMRSRRAVFDQIKGGSFNYVRATESRRPGSII